MTGPTTSPHLALTARDIMTHSLVTFRPETNIWDAIKKLVTRRISAAPVVDADGHLVGMLSELDCLNVLASDEFHADDHSGSTVSDYMTTVFETAGPESDIYALAQKFLNLPVRRFPVIENGRLLGQVSLSDVMRGIEEMRKKRSSLRRRYPDYQKPL
jgi:CBS domain-containing protein